MAHLSAYFQDRIGKNRHRHKHQNAHPPIKGNHCHKYGHDSNRFLDNIAEEIFQGALGNRDIIGQSGHYLAGFLLIEEVHGKTQNMAADFVADIYDNPRGYITRQVFL